MEKEIKKIMAETLGVTVDNLRDDVTLSSLGADELDIVEVTLDLELAFSVEIPEEDEYVFQGPIKTIVEYMQKKIEGRNPYA